MPTSASKHGLPRQFSSPPNSHPSAHHHHQHRGSGHDHHQLHIPTDGHVLPQSAAIYGPPVPSTTAAENVTESVTAKA